MGAAASWVAVGEKVSLRRLVSGDLEYLYRWENDPEVWRYGDCGAEVSGLSGGRDVSDGQDTASGRRAVSDGEGTASGRRDVSDGQGTASDGRVVSDGEGTASGRRDVSGGEPVAATPVERFSREQLRELIENQQYGATAAGQLRLVVCRREGAGLLAAGSTAAAMWDAAVGFVDLFDLDPVERSAGVGILICDPADRRKGYGREALELMMDHARRELGLSGLWCTIAPDNGASIALFSGAGFVRREGMGFVRRDGAELRRKDAHSDGELFFEKRLRGCLNFATELPTSREPSSLLEWPRREPTTSREQSSLFGLPRREGGKRS